MIPMTRGSGLPQADRVGVFSLRKQDFLDKRLGRTTTFVMKTASGAGDTRKLWIALGCLVCLPLGLSTGCSTGRTEASAVAFSTPCQLVLLNNNAVYFGRLSGWGTSNPVLSDVFFVNTTTNPETHQVSQALVRRNREPHHPDKMYLNPSQVMFVEPVATDSKAVQLIGEASK
jgi:hypothetical protein